jgi:hypothetical protein
MAIMLLTPHITTVIIREMMHENRSTAEYDRYTMENMREFVDLLMNAPDNLLDASLKPKIGAWSEPPTSLQILEVLDFAIRGALASSVVVSVLESVYSQRLDEEKTTHEEVVKNAMWRNQ